ncbi:MAG: ABC transporter ATP-binding protein [Actinobacteria bacterium]|nr:ABC transporter ATP-binding protein [Actinomycetota bacterium]
MSLLAQLGVRRGAFRLDVSLEVESGQVVALLGPNGSGKSTALHALAGLVAIDEGTIELDGASVDDPATGAFVPPNERSVSLVFQDYLLFPHLTAIENVAFGLRARGIGARVAREQAESWLEQFGLDDKATCKPRELSGGQAQRVALTRALAPNPRLLLLDEPLASLDAGTRAIVRRDLRRHLDAFEGPAIIVTHDPLDALALATHVVAIDAGRITQAGPIADLTARPRSRYVADLVGLNLLGGVAHGTTITVASGATITTAEPGEGAVFALIHPHAVALHTRPPPEGSPRNQWAGRAAGFDLLGDRVRVRVAGAVPLVAEITAAALTDLGLHDGQEVWTAVKATEIVTYPR